jgi:hypothetical protein
MGQKSSGRAVKFGKRYTVTTQDPTSKLNLQEDGVQLLLNRVNEAEKCGM